MEQRCNYKSVVRIIEHVFEIQFKSNIHFELRLNTLKLSVEGTHIPYQLSHYSNFYLLKNKGSFSSIFYDKVHFRIHKCEDLSYCLSIL